MHSYQIGYTAFNVKDFKTQVNVVEFDIEVDDAVFENAFVELWDLIYTYCKENNLIMFQINYIQEVPYYEY